MRSEFIRNEKKRTGSIGSNPLDAYLRSAVPVKQLKNLLRRKLRCVPGLQLRQLLLPGIGTHGTDLGGMIAHESGRHRSVMPLVGDRPTSALLHAMGSFMGQGVPNLSRGLMGSAHHEGVTSGVIKALQTATRTVLLNNTHTGAGQSSPQGIDGIPGCRASGQNTQDNNRNTGQQKGLTP